MGIQHGLLITLLTVVDDQYQFLEKWQIASLIQHHPFLYTNICYLYCLGGTEASSSWKKGHAGHKNSKVPSVLTKQHRQHSIPELSPIRPQIDIQQACLNNSISSVKWKINAIQHLLVKKLPPPNFILDHKIVVLENCCYSHVYECIRKEETFPLECHMTYYGASLSLPSRHQKVLGIGWKGKERGIGDRGCACHAGYHGAK